MSGKWLCLLIKCNLVNADMKGKLVPSTPKGSAPLPIRARGAEALEGMDTRGSTQSTVPSPFSHIAQCSFLLQRQRLCPTASLEVPAPTPSGQAAYIMPITFKLFMSNKQGWIHYFTEEKEKTHYVGQFCFKRDGCFEYLQQSSGRQMGCPWIKWTRVYDTDIYHAHIYKLRVLYSIINQ